MTNPFENDESLYTVLKNAEGQHSLWPTFAPVPAGWAVAFGPDQRQSCLDFVSESWPSLRPARFGRAGEGAEAAAGAAVGQRP